MGSLIGLNIPLLPDYVQKGSLGLAGGINQMVVCAAFTFGTTGMYKINDYVSD